MKISTSKRRLFPASRQDGFILNAANIVILVLAGALVLAALFEVYKLLAPKAPPRAELLHTANAIMASVNTIREQVEANEDFKKANELYSAPQTGTFTGAEFNYIVKSMTGDPSTKTDRIQAELKSSQAAYDTKAKAINDSINTLLKKYTGGGKAALTQIETLKELNKASQSFSDYALHPSQEESLHKYVGGYRANRAAVLMCYKNLINSLKTWDVHEKATQEENWKKELRIADENAAQY